MSKGFVSTGALIGLALGLLDALTLHFNILGARFGLPEMDLSIWTIAPLVWVALTTVVAIVVRRLPLVFALCFGLLLLFRWSVPLRRSWIAEGRIPALFPYATELLAVAATLVVLIPAVWLVRRIAPRLMPAAHRMRFALVAVLITIAALAAASRWPATADAPQRSARVDAPSLVLIFLDTLRYDTSSLRDPQSHLSQLARSGVAYTNAFAPAPWTLPSHVAVVTGLPATRLSIDFERNRYAGNTPTLAETLSASGYVTAAILANPLLAAGTNFDRGYQTVAVSKNDRDLCRTAPFEILSRFVKPPLCGLPGCSWTAPEVTRRAVAFIERTKRPYFLTLNYMDPHLPYYVPRECRPAGFRPFHGVADAQVLYAVNRSGIALPESRRRMLLETQRASADCIDRALGDLLAAIRASEQGERTIVAVVGDHGEQFGEHGMAMHGNSVYRQVLHVPLVLAGPAVTQRPPVRQPVDITALHGTLLQLMGRPSRGTSALPMDDAQWSPVFSRYEPPRHTETLAPRFRRGAWSVVADDHHLIAFDTGRVELYAAGDLEERHDLAARPDRAAVRARLLDLVSRARTERQRHDRAAGEEALRTLPYLR